MITKKTVFIISLSIFIFLVWAGNGILGAEEISPRAVKILSKSTQAEEILQVPISKEFGERQRYVITFKEKPFGYKDFIISLGGRVTHDYTIIEGIAVEVPTAAAERLIELPNIRSIQLDEMRFTSLTESVPLINADDVWAKGYSGAGKNVCIVDTGVDYNHSALSGKVLKQKCYCLGNSGPSGCCPGGGEVEDNALDDAGHGTHVAGIVASIDSTYKGVAYGANIYAVKVLDSSGSGYMSDVIAGIDWCRDNGADIINLSLGGGTKYSSYCDSTADAQAVNNAVNAGKFVAIASGNSAWTDGISSPACASKGTSVGDVYDANVGGIGWGSPLVCSDPTTAPDKIVCHCNRGTILDMLAPGALINSAKLGGGFVQYGGTSMAAPHVAGAAALLLEAKPTLTPAEIENVLKSTGVNITDTGGSGLTFPRIDVLAAFNQVYVSEVEVKTFRDSSYSEEDKFFNLGETIYIQAKVTAGGSPITGATVTAELILSNTTTEATLSLTEIGGGIYRNSWDSFSHNVDVYSVEVSVSGPATGEGEGYFHLYSGSGVSAYQLDWDSDEAKDFVLENKHLISIFDGATNTDKSLLYLYQKDTDVAYTFKGISDTNSIGRGEITTANLDNIKFHTFSLSQQGENLTSANLGVKTDITQAATGGQSCMFDDDDTGGRSALGSGMKAGFTAATSGTLEFWARCKAQTNKDSFDIMLENSSNTVGPDVYFLNGSIGYYDGAQKTIMAYTPDQWYHFKILFDAGTDKMNIYIEDMETPKVTNAGFWNILTDISKIEFDTGQWLSGTPLRDRFDPLCYVDDVSIYSGITTLLSDNFESYTPGANPGSPWTVIEDSAKTNVEISNTVYHQPPGVSTSINISAQMRTEDVDYLVYKLSNFDANIDDLVNIFSPISGNLGSSVADDRYHFGNGTDGPITDLTPNSWTNFSAVANQQRYVAVYDNSTASDPVSDNVISWIYFPNASSTAFQDVGLWYETGKEGLRIRYDTTSATSTNEAEYILSFFKGNYTNIDYWMSDIASGQFPAPNFMAGTPALTRSNFPANSWQMISVPLQPENPDPEAILSDDLGAIFYNWTLARWQPFEGVYKYHKATCCPWATSSESILPDFSPGLAYWLITRLGPTDIDASGALTPDNDYSIHLSPGTSTQTGGWNQIGVPFNYSVDWSSSTIKVKNTETQETVDLDTAQANNWLENKIWWQDGTSTQYSFAIAPEGQLDPWQGYFVHNFIESDLIISPTPIQGAGGQAASIESLQEIQSKPLLKPQQGKRNCKDLPPLPNWSAPQAWQKWQDCLPEWKLQLSIQGQDTYNFAGISPAAEDDYDALDVLEPPPISKGINLYFPHSDWSFNPGNFTQDIRKSDFRKKEWDFEIKNDFKNSPITLKWFDLEQVEYYDLSLIDLDTNQTIDIYNTADYTFELEKGGIRHFKLIAEVNADKGRFFKK